MFGCGIESRGSGSLDLTSCNGSGSGSGSGWLSVLILGVLSLSFSFSIPLVSGVVLIGRGASHVYPNPSYHYKFTTYESSYGYYASPETVSNNEKTLAVNRSNRLDGYSNNDNFYPITQTIAGPVVGGFITRLNGNPKYDYVANSHLVAPIKLSKSYTTSIWFNWFGLGAVASRGIQNHSTLYIAQGQGENGISASLYIDTTGYVIASHGSFSIVDPDPVPPYWTQYTTSYNGNTGFLALYRNGALVASGTDISQSFIGSVAPTILLNTRTFNNVFAGSLSAWSVWNCSLTTSEVWWYYWTNNPTYIVPLPGTTPSPSTNPPSTRWWGHLNTTEVTTQHRTPYQPTGWLNISGVILDVDLRPSNLFWVRMFGVRGVSVSTPVSVPGVGFVSWDAPTFIMIIEPFSLIPAGTPFSFSIPDSVFSLSHGSEVISQSDVRWQMAITLEKDQTGGRRQGLRWQPIHYTPDTTVGDWNKEGI